MLIKTSTERTRQTEFQSQPPGQFGWDDGSSMRCPWARCPLRHLPQTPPHRYRADAAAVMLRLWRTKDAAEVRFVGKGGSGQTNKGCLWGKKKKPDILLGGQGHHSPPSFAIYPGGNKLSRWGLLPRSPTSDWCGWHPHVVPRCRCRHKPGLPSLNTLPASPFPSKQPVMDRWSSPLQRYVPLQQLLLGQLHFQLGLTLRQNNETPLWINGISYLPVLQFPNIQVLHRLRLEKSGCI